MSLESLHIYTLQLAPQYYIIKWFSATAKEVRFNIFWILTFRNEHVGQPLSPLLYARRGCRYLVLESIIKQCERIKHKIIQQGRLQRWKLAT
mgnify:CR=1 FL=1